MLCFDPNSSLWEWDLTAIREEIMVTENVLTLLQHRLYRSRCFEIQDLLTPVAGSVAFIFRVDALCGFVNQEREVDPIIHSKVAGNVQRLLDKSVKEGLIQDSGGGTFRFGHDKIQ
jgi:hypothetical protein